MHPASQSNCKIMVCEVGWPAVSLPVRFFGAGERQKERERGLDCGHGRLAEACKLRLNRRKEWLGFCSDWGCRWEAAQGTNQPRTGGGLAPMKQKTGSCFGLRGEERGSRYAAVFGSFTMLDHHHHDLVNFLRADTYEYPLRKLSHRDSEHWWSSRQEAQEPGWSPWWL